jgi:hypothetical protein
LRAPGPFGRPGAPAVLDRLGAAAALNVVAVVAAGDDAL